MSKPAAEKQRVPDVSTRHSKGWRSLVVVAPAIAFLAIAVAAASSLLWGSANGENCGPLAHMKDLSSELVGKIRAVGENGLRKTIALSNSPRLPEVIRRHDRAAAEALANELLANSLELDIVAIFDAEGRLLGVNSEDHEHRPIERSRLEALYQGDFSKRDVIQRCLSDKSRESRMEFQTHCDFTPPIFGSSGLSVAYSAPVNESGSSAHLGVVSTRLNFQRIADLAQENSFVRAGNSVFLVSDAGELFDEETNSGRRPAPLSQSEAQAALGAAIGGARAGALARIDGDVLLGVPVSISHAMAGGGLNVVLKAAEKWVKGETTQARLVAGSALLVSLAAVGIWTLYVSSRTSKLRALAALGTERARTAMILESAGEGIVAVDSHGNLSYANSAACGMLGATQPGMLRQPWTSYAPSATTGGAANEWHTEEAILRRADGSQFHARVTTAGLPDDAGSVVTFLDLTAQMELQAQLLKATRQAGMAEVATGVLHNVGNVLNSVNVSANLVNERIRKSEVASLKDAGDALQQHRGDLARFLSTDARGKHFADYLVQLAQCLGAERTSLLEELEVVTRGVEHVKHIISMQQEHAKKQGVLEKTRADRMFIDALEMQKSELRECGIAVECDFDPSPAILVDKHQVIQILVNLICNATQAMAASGARDKRLTLSLRAAIEEGKRFIHFEVSDNGIGIPSQNLTKVFSHGFTTRKDGHGFGLHSASNVAKTMGGSLTAFSDGIGKGARFVLSIPVHEVGILSDGGSEALQPTVEDACTAS
ncbi:MAG: PAS domain S-box protein [Phycisphaeraceae bacterium]|nr:PAS domain S-box protein [Phycisphaeraceae bacterium]